MKKSLIVLVMLMFGFLECYSQKGNTEITKESGFSERIYKGGGVGLSFSSNVASFSLSPIIGYMVTDRLSFGVGATYQYYKYQTPTFEFQDNMYGGRVFSIMRLKGRLYGYGAYTFINYSVNGDSNNRKTAYRLPVGLSYGFSAGPRSNLFFLFAYDLLYDINSPFGQPWITSFFVTF